jgi:hypothetical protein
MDPRDEPAADGRPDTLLAATLLLMSAYAREGGSPRLAGAVLQHLELLAARADVPGVITATCDHAADLWVQLARPSPVPPRAVLGTRDTPARPRRPMSALLRLVVG